VLQENGVAGQHRRDDAVDGGEQRVVPGRQVEDHPQRLTHDAPLEAGEGGENHVGERALGERHHRPGARRAGLHLAEGLREGLAHHARDVGGDGAGVGLQLRDGSLAQGHALVQRARPPGARGVVHAIEGDPDAGVVGQRHLAGGLAGERIVDDENAKIAHGPPSIARVRSRSSPRGGECRPRPGPGAANAVPVLDQGRRMPSPSSIVTTGRELLLRRWRGISRTPSSHDATLRKQSRRYGSTMSQLHLKLDAQGLVPAIVQDHLTGEIRMFAYASEAAVRMTLETGHATFWSRSRAELWQKGRVSGHETPVVRVLADCDADCIIYSSDPQSPSCHSGAPSCFFQAFDGERLGQASEQPQTVLASLEATARGSDEHVVAEAADSLVHLVAGLRSRSITLRRVLAEVSRRLARGGQPTMSSRPPA
jgi:phosphoribosyl-AMP cyclohydrolase